MPIRSKKYQSIPRFLFRLNKNVRGNNLGGAALVRVIRDAVPIAAQSLCCEGMPFGMTNGKFQLRDRSAIGQVILSRGEQKHLFLRVEADLKAAEKVHSEKAFDLRVWEKVVNDDR